MSVPTTNPIYKEISSQITFSGGVAILTKPHPFTFYPKTNDPSHLEMKPKDQPHVTYESCGSAHLLYPNSDGISVPSTVYENQTVEASFHTNPSGHVVNLESDQTEKFKKCFAAVVGAPVGIMLHDDPTLLPHLELVVGPDTDFKNGVRNEEKAICGTKAFKIYRPGPDQPEKTKQLFSKFISEMGL